MIRRPIAASRRRWRASSGICPERLDVVHPALDQHHVERALAQDLVGEVGFSVLRIPRRRQTVHDLNY